MKFPPQRIRISPRDREFILKGLEGIFDSGQYAYGWWTQAFEEVWQGVVGTRFTVAAGSGTQALEMIIRGLRLRGKRIAVPNCTYIATAQAVLHSGAFVHLVDCDPQTGQMLPEALPKTQDAVDAVVVVHLGGNISPRLGEIIDYCRIRGIPLIEDAAHAHGAESEFGKAGAIGQAAMFSMYPTKVVPGGGELGTLTTNDPELEKFARRFRHHGRDNDPEDPSKYTSVIQGANFCPSEFQALFAFTQVNRLREHLENRRRAATIYREAFHLVESFLPSFYKVLTLDKVTAPFPLPGKVYSTPLHLEPAFGFVGQRFPGSESWAKDHTALPIYNDITEEEAREIVNILKSRT